ncbi:uncharacterized [Tachysurus ichikawai]
MPFHMISFPPETVLEESQQCSEGQLLMKKELKPGLKLIIRLMRFEHVFRRRGCEFCCVSHSSNLGKMATRRVVTSSAVGSFAAREPLRYMIFWIIQGFLIFLAAWRHHRSENQNGIP